MWRSHILEGEGDGALDAVRATDVVGVGALLRDRVYLALWDGLRTANPV